MNLADFKDEMGFLHEYLALPDAGTIASLVCPAKSASAAAKLYAEARDEAWRIRMEMAKSWSDDALIEVMKLLSKRLSDVPRGSWRVHPILGPLLAVRGPSQGIDRMLETMLRVCEDSEREEKRKAKQERFNAMSKEEREKYDARLLTGTQSRERRVMTRCVQSYVDWVSSPEGKRGVESLRFFPKKRGITEERSVFLLGTLLTAIENESVEAELLQRLQERYFPSATETGIAECLSILRD